MMSDKRFLIVSAVFPPEPVVSAKLSYDLATKLAIDNDVLVLSPRPTRPFGFCFEANKVKGTFEHVVLNSFTCPQSNLFGRLKETYSFGKQCAAYITEHHKAIKHIYSNTWPLFAQYYTVKTAKKFNIPVTIHVQDIYPESLSNKFPIGKSILNFLLMPIDRYIFKHAANVIAISDKMGNYLSESRGIHRSKITTVYNWQDEVTFEEYHLSKGIDRAQLGKQFTFMYLGNVGPVAGVDLLIDAFALAKIGNSKLIIAGSGSMKSELEKLARSYKDVHIEFWTVPEGSVQVVQDSADVLLLPMKKGAASSSIPSKLPAYLFSKKPVIACVDSGSDTAQAIVAGDCGWILAPEDVSKLAGKMKEVVLMPKEELNHKGENGFNYSIAKFSKKINLEKLANVINPKL
jgi:glycosyltransferase involved in cell wall biosynthesis